MGEPARKIREDIEPEIRPNLHVIDGGGQSTSERANLKALESNPEKVDNKSSIKDSEETGSNAIQGPWGNKVTGKSNGPTKGKFNLAGLKKKGPLATIILTLVGGGLGIGGLLSPSLLLVNLKEVITDKFNTQLTSMDIRTNKILSKKTTTGVCGSILTIGCKYSTMSKRQVANFDKAGITVIADDTTSLLGRTKPTGFEFDGKKIDAADFSQELAENAKFRSAIKRAYNPKFAGFTDAVWNKVSSFLKISKSPPDLEGEDFDSKSENLADDLEDANKLEKQPIPDGDDIDPSTGEEFTDDALDAAQDQAEFLNEIVEDAGGDGSLATKALNGAEELGNAFKITGALDDGCTVYRTFRALGYAAKAVRVMQLASYAILFLQVADQIKAGDANPDDVAFYGDVLTQTTLNDDGQEVSATDSMGYQYAAYGNVVSNQTDAMKYMAAAGLVGGFINFFASHPKALSGTCDFLGNPFVGFVSLASGLALTVVSMGGWAGVKAAAVSAKAAGMASAKAAIGKLMRDPGFWAGAGIGLAEIFLPSLLKDIVAGKIIDKYTVGADAGNAIVSGASGIMGTTAKYGGNAPLTPEQAVAYYKLSDSVLADYAKEDRLAYSPFDISNKNTFLGNIAFKLTPSLIGLSSISNAIRSIASIVFTSFSSLNPIASAESPDDYSTCQDISYRDLGLATDPFCNVIYGVPVEYLDVDPTAVAEALVASGDIYESDNTSNGVNAGDIIPDSKYSDFIQSCIERVEPLGEGSDTGDECLFNEENKNYYIYYIDKRVQDGMDAEETVSSSTPGGSADPGDASQPDNTVSSKKGWTFKSDTDYSGVACADGTTEVGIFTTGKNNIKMRICKMPDGLTKVSSVISKRTLNMINAAKEAGVTLKASGLRSSFRSIEDQMYFREKHCPDPLNSPSSACTPDTALPGSSMHERGLAIDFANSSKGGAVWNWLAGNGASYGYFNYPPENWHWSMSGS